MEKKKRKPKTGQIDLDALREFVDPEQEEELLEAFIKVEPDQIPPDKDKPGDNPVAKTVD